MMILPVLEAYNTVTSQLQSLFLDAYIKENTADTTPTVIVTINGLKLNKFVIYDSNNNIVKQPKNELPCLTVNF